METELDINESASDSLLHYGSIRKLMLPIAKSLATADAELSRIEESTNGRARDILDEMCIACECKIYRFVLEDLNAVGFKLSRKEGGAA